MAEDKQIITGFTYDIRDKQLNMGLEFGSDIDLNAEVSIPVKQYGFIDFYPSNNARGFFIGFRLNMNILEDNEILDMEKTRLLQGQPMSQYVTTDLIRHRLVFANNLQPILFGTASKKHILWTSIRTRIYG